MGFAASQARLMALTARKSDLEFLGQLINQARLTLANIQGRLFALMAQAPDGRGTLLQIQLAQLQLRDKALELELKRLDTQRDAIITEIDAVKKVISKNIQMSFKTFG